MIEKAYRCSWNSKGGGSLCHQSDSRSRSSGVGIDGGDDAESYLRSGSTLLDEADCESGGDNSPTGGYQYPIISLKRF